MSTLRIGVNSNRVAIVDAYSAANQLVESFNDRGFDCIHVRSNPTVPICFQSSFKRGDFVHEVIHRGDLIETSRALTLLEPKYVIAGMETGVELCDQICDMLLLPGNEPKLATSRRHKQAMLDRVESEGVKVPRSVCGSDESLLCRWVEAHTVYPVVLKPTRSAGADGVVLCDSESQLLDAIRSTIGNSNVFGEINVEVIVQELIKGIEYSVDTVTHAGEHILAEMWRYYKLEMNGSHFVYDIDELVDPSNKDCHEVVAYAFQVLDAFRHLHGPAHVEVMMTEAGPTLIEAGFRIDGYSNPIVSRECTGRSQIDLTTLAICEPIDWGKIHLFYTRKRHCWKVSLIVHDEGVVGDLTSLQRVEALPSFHSSRIKVEIGQRLYRTKDTASCPGFITLVANNRSELQRDYKELRRLEKIGLFGIGAEDKFL